MPSTLAPEVNRRSTNIDAPTSNSTPLSPNAGASTHDRNRQVGIHPPSISIAPRTVHISVRHPGPSNAGTRALGSVRPPLFSDKVAASHETRTERRGTARLLLTRFVFFLVWILPFWCQIHSVMLALTHEAAPPSHLRVSLWLGRLRWSRLQMGVTQPWLHEVRRESLDSACAEGKTWAVDRRGRGEALMGCKPHLAFTGHSPVAFSVLSSTPHDLYRLGDQCAQCRRPKRPRQTALTTWQRPASQQRPPAAD